VNGIERGQSVRDRNLLVFAGRQTPRKEQVGDKTADQPPAPGIKPKPRRSMPSPRLEQAEPHSELAQSDR